MSKKAHKKSTIISEGQEVASKKSDYYVSKEDLYDAMCERKQAVDAAKANGDELPVVSDYIAQCLYKIADGLKRKYNFANNQHYSDEMVGDALMACIRAIDSFDPEISSNPFAYFTQVSYYAFMNRIKTEQKQTYVRFRSSINAIQDNSIMDSGEGDETDPNAIMDTMDTTQDYVDSFVEDYEQKNNLGMYKKKRGRKPKDDVKKEEKKTGLAKFME